MKLYTVGQIAKKYQVPLAEVYKWRQLLSEAKLTRGGRGEGTVRIKDDPYGRYGYPEELVKYFPNLPPKDGKTFI